MAMVRLGGGGGEREGGPGELARCVVRNRPTSTDRISHTSHVSTYEPCTLEQYDNDGQDRRSGLREKGRKRPLENLTPPDNPTALLQCPLRGPVSPSSADSVVRT